MSDDKKRAVTLVEFFEGRESVNRRLLAALRLIDLFKENLRFDKTPVIDPATLMPALDDVLANPWPPQAFEAPEGSPWNKQGYKLAVYLSQILTGTHPYKGRRYYEAAILDDETLHALFVGKPEYVFASNSKAPNAPLTYAQPNVKDLFNSLDGVKLNAELKKVFGPEQKVWFPENTDLLSSVLDLRDRLWAKFSMNAADPSVAVYVEGHPIVLSQGKPIVLPSTLETIGYCEYRALPSTGENQPFAVNSGPYTWRRPGNRSKSGKAEVPKGNVVPITVGLNFVSDDYGDIILKNYNADTYQKKSDNQ